MAYLVDQLGLSGTLQYFHVERHAHDFDQEQVAAIRLHWVPRALDLPTEMAVITALLPTHVAAFAGTTGTGGQWIVTLERALVSPGDRLRYFAGRSERLHTYDDTGKTIYLTDAELRGIYADGGAGPQTDLVGFTSLLIGLQVETFGYPLGEVVANMNAECAFPDDEHDCEGSFFADIGAVWAIHAYANEAARARANATAADVENGDGNDTEVKDSAADADVAAAIAAGEFPGEINLVNPDGSQWTYIPCYGDQYSPGETGWILTMTGPRALDPQPVGLADMLGDFEAMGLADSTAPQLAIILTEAIADSLRAGHVAHRKHPNEQSALQRLEQIEAELAEARGGANTSASTGADEGSASDDGLELALMRPLEDQTDEEFLDDFVEAFRGFVEGVKDPDPSPEAVERRSAQAKFGRWRHEQNLWREQEVTGECAADPPRPVPHDGDDTDQPR